MRTPRTLLLLAVMTAAAFALSAGTAAAQDITVLQEAHENNQNPPCQTLTENVHVVTGGCHFELRSAAAGIPLFVHTGTAELQVLSCVLDLEGRVRTNGTGHVSQAAFSPAPTGTCTRAPCDEPDGSFIPWPLQIEEVAPVTEHVELVFCLRLATDPPGTAGTTCHIVLPWRTTGTHMYEAGTNGVEVACENNPAVEFSNHFETLPHEGEEIEVAH